MLAKSRWIEWNDISDVIMEGTVDYARAGGVGGVIQQPVVAPPPVAGTFHQTNVGVNDQGLGVRYNIKAGQATGWVQLLCSISAIILGIAKIFARPFISFTYIGYGIWGGLLFFLPAGILGIISKNNNSRVIVAYMVMSILSAVVAAFVLSFGILDALFVWHGQYVTDIVMSIVGLTEFITAIVASAYCCAAVCCGRPSRQVQRVNYTNQPAVVVSTSPYNQQQVVVPIGGQPVVAPSPGYTFPTTYPQEGYPQGSYPNMPNQPTIGEQHGQGKAPPEYDAVAGSFPQKQAMT